MGQSLNRLAVVMKQPSAQLATCRTQTGIPDTTSSPGYGINEEFHACGKPVIPGPPLCVQPGGWTPEILSPPTHCSHAPWLLNARSWPPAKMNGNIPAL
jgi:hypothetical protein